jgi:16S rRNA (guanine527-N7)-methyltransferase
LRWPIILSAARETVPRAPISACSVYNRNSMTPARIAMLLAPFLQAQPLNPGQLSSISTYIDILLRWNSRINLTAIRDPEEIVTRHFGESLFAARHLFPQAGAMSLSPRSSAPSPLKPPKVADLGSGAGFPGVPIKLWAPHIALTLIESNHKKATFLREVARALTLTDINIQNARAESLSPGAYDLVTLRAVERFETILPVAASLVAPGGRLALLISAAQLPHFQTALPDYVLGVPLPVPTSNFRLLVVAKKP